LKNWNNIYQSSFKQMKRILTNLLLAGLMGSMMAQVPHPFSYQAVARDSTGDCLTDQLISLRFSIIDDSAATNPIYEELFTDVQTNGVGHFQVEIGTGAPQPGSPNFDELNWNTTRQQRHLKVELAPDNDLNLQEVGMTQLLAVPYATAAANGKQYDHTNDNEFIDFQDANGNARADMGVNSNNRGYLTWRGPNGSFNGILDASSNDNEGALSIRDANGTPQVILSIDANGGYISANGANGGVKNFTMDHPHDPTKKIWYASVEGPEAAAYERGSIQMVNGEAEIAYSDHFAIVANPTTMTVMLTPWSAESKGIAVVEQTATGFKVKELQQGTGNYRVDWEVKAVRKGWEDYKAVREKQPDPYLELQKTRANH
jgi:hypothetical protein